MTAFEFISKLFVCFVPKYKKNGSFLVDSMTRNVGKGVKFCLLSICRDHRQDQEESRSSHSGAAKHPLGFLSLKEFSKQNQQKAQEQPYRRVYRV